MGFRRFRRRAVETPAIEGRPFSDSDWRSESDSSGGRGSVVAASRRLPRRELTDLLDIGVWGVPRDISVSYPRVRVRSQPSGRRVFPSWKPAVSVFSKDRLRAQLRANPRAGFCVRRKQRREVIHALGIAGRVGLRGRGGSYYRRESSQWVC